MEVASGPSFSQEFHWSGAWQSGVTWRGVCALKCPLDLWSYQQILFDTRPGLIIECGVAGGGTTLFLADLLHLLGGGLVLGIDRSLAAVAESVVHHPYVRLIEAPSLSENALRAARGAADGIRTMVILDSDHWVSHVYEELRHYAEFVTPGCYLICEDGNLDRPGAAVAPGYVGPHTALQHFLAERSDFVVDAARVLGATFNPNGYLRRIEPPT